MLIAKPKCVDYLICLTGYFLFFPLLSDSSSNVDIPDASNTGMEFLVSCLLSLTSLFTKKSNSCENVVPWSQRLSCILYWQILRREPLLSFVFIGTKRWEPRKESLWSRPLGASLSCHQLLTVVSDWRIFFIALRVIWLDGLNIFGMGVEWQYLPLWVGVENFCFINGFSYQGRIRFSF